MADAATTVAIQGPDMFAALWEEAGWLPCNLTVELPVANFAVHDLLELTAGSLVETDWKCGEDTPLRVNGWQIGWAEFEQMGEALGVRLTELL
jgi:flagellar motor switch/type III secretory pathway protein FliN